MSAPPFTVALVDLPQPADLSVLFPELAAPGCRPFEVAVTVPAETPAPGGAETRTVMVLRVPAGSAGAAVDTAVRACEGMRWFEITVRPASAPR